MNVTEFPKRQPQKQIEPPTHTKLLDVLMDGRARSRITVEVVNLARTMTYVADRQAAWLALVDKYETRMRREGAMPGEIARAMHLLTTAVKAENSHRDEVARTAIRALDPLVEIAPHLTERGQLLRFPIVEESFVPAGAK